jgi:SOS-response transcriptional repressor LexA
MIEVTVPVRRHTFALRVKGDSMVDASGNGPSFPEGISIVVEPDAEPRHKRFVVVKSNDEAEATFKQLIIDGGDMYLKPLNTAYKTKPFPADGRICGVVVQAVWTFD